MTCFDWTTEIPKKKILLSCKDLLANGEQSHSFNYFFLDFFLLLKMQVLGVYFIWLNISNAGLGGQHIHSLLLSYFKNDGLSSSRIWVGCIMFPVF